MPRSSLRSWLLCVGIIVLAVYYRMGTFAIVSNVAVALMGALLLFAYFHAQFGVGALLGLVLVAFGTAFGGIYYFAKLKEGLYQGKALKKASSDATRKSLWPTIDVGIVSIIVGLCVYGLVSGAVGKLD
jgi:multidrug efflux pump subunit AcrB